MGYYRPVSHFNQGKKAEHYGRLHFDEKISLHGMRTPLDLDEEEVSNTRTPQQPVEQSSSCPEYSFMTN